MQPDPTPDLDELFEPGWLERCDWCGWPLVKTPDKGCVESDCSMRPTPFTRDTRRKQTARSLLRAARERDELRAERDRAVARATSRKLKNQSHAEWRKLCARVGTARATIKKRERRIIALAALRDELRARAEKAEADLAESLAMYHRARDRADALQVELTEARAEIDRMRAAASFVVENRDKITDAVDKADALDELEAWVSDSDKCGVESVLIQKEPDGFVCVVWGGMATELSIAAAIRAALEKARKS